MSFTTRSCIVLAGSYRGEKEEQQRRQRKLRKLAMSGFRIFRIWVYNFHVLPILSQLQVNPIWAGYIHIGPAHTLQQLGPINLLLSFPLRAFFSFSCCLLMMNTSNSRRDTLSNSFLFNLFSDHTCTFAKKKKDLPMCLW